MGVSKYSEQAHNGLQMSICDGMLLDIATLSWPESYVGFPIPICADVSSHMTTKKVRHHTKNALSNLNLVKIVFLLGFLIMP